jgi:hypothetical protein
VLEHGEKRRAGRGKVEDDGGSPFYRRRGGGRWLMINTEEWPTLMGTKWLFLKWQFTLQNEEGGRGK